MTRLAPMAVFTLRPKVNYLKLGYQVLTQLVTHLMECYVFFFPGNFHLATLADGAGRQSRDGRSDEFGKKSVTDGEEFAAVGVVEPADVFEI